MYYDLHIHSKLSPCADDLMSVNNIVNMALIKGLDLISVTDHNSTLQQKVIAKVAQSKGLNYLYGVEITTSEEIHMLCYFRKYEEIERFQKEIDQCMTNMVNDEKYFGNQLIFNEFDEVIGKEQRMLSNSLTKGIEQWVDIVHQMGGSCVLAHVLDRANGIITQLGFIPSKLQVDGIEVKDEMQRKKVLELSPHLENLVFLYNSDAHYLVDIKEAEQYLSKQEYNALWRHSL